MKKPLIVSIIIITLLSGLLCGCIGDSGESEEESPLKLEPYSYSTVYEGTYNKYTSSEPEIYSDTPLQEYWQPEPPTRQISITLKVKNDENKLDDDSIFTISVPEGWQVSNFGCANWIPVNTTDKHGHDLIINIYTAPGSKFLGYDYNEDEFADIYDPDDNFHAIDCEQENTNKVYSDGCTPGQYKIKINAEDSNGNKAELEYKVILE